MLRFVSLPNKQRYIYIYIAASEVRSANTPQQHTEEAFIIFHMTKALRKLILKFSTPSPCTRGFVFFFLLGWYGLTENKFNSKAIKSKNVSHVQLKNP